MRFFALLLAWFALLPGLSPAQAQLPGMKIHVHATLEAETLKPAPGETVTLAFNMRPEKGWHGYWQNPGDAGLGMSLGWKLPPGLSAGPLRFPVPETLIISGFMNYIYKDPHAILVDLKIPANVAPGTKLPISVEAQWLACSDRVCVPQQGVFDLELVVAAQGAKPEKRLKFDSWRAALPVQIDRQAEFAVAGKRIELAFPYPANAALEEPYFFPATLELFDYMAPQNWRRNGDWLIVETRLSPDFKGLPPTTIEGLLRISRGQGLLVRSKAGLVPSGGKSIEYSVGSPDEPLRKTPSLSWLLLGALAGGMLLNIMPCVFPILGLKAIALAKAGGRSSTARRDAIGYTAGAMLSCIALGATLLLLRAAGEEVGWAFQLQEPAIVLLLLVLMSGIAANLAGLFPIGSINLGGLESKGILSSFGTGALAAFVATPCTGPFMAAALGAALLLPPLEALLLFAMLGLGLALPFPAIAFVPAFRNRLPKPGPWMEVFRKTMAIPMALTAMALLWLLWRLSGQGGLVIGLVVASVFLILVWALGRQRPTGVGLAAMALGLALASLAGSWLPDGNGTDVARSNSALPTEAFSEERLAELRSQGRRVFVYFTADWCVTCKVNEAAVLERPETAKLFADRSVSVLRGDFTKRNPEIARFLYDHGAAGVPLYLYYPVNGDAEVLPQLLTSSELSSVLKARP